MVWTWLCSVVSVLAYEELSLYIYSKFLAEYKFHIPCNAANGRPLRNLNSVPRQKFLSCSVTCVDKI